MSPSEFLNFQTSVEADGQTTMNESNLLQSLGQVSSESAAKVFRDQLRSVVRELMCDVMAEEVNDLRGRGDSMLPGSQGTKHSQQTF